jgi:hypothetical protein
VAEGGALLRRYTGLNPYREFESLSLRHFLAACAGAVLLGGCAQQPQWARADATPETMNAELRTCQDSAPLQPRVAMPRVNPAGSGMDFRSAAIQEENQFVKDEQHVAKCMAAKGYSQAQR